MATTNDKLEQQKAQTQELADDELDQATGGSKQAPPPPEYIAPSGTFL